MLCLSDMAANILPPNLTENELHALELLIEAGGSLLTTSLPEKNVRDVVFGTVEPGHTVYRKLEKMGLVFYTVEDPVEMPGDPLDGFTFTNEVYISDEGRDAALDATSKREKYTCSK